MRGLEAHTFSFQKQLACFKRIKAKQHMRRFRAARADQSGHAQHFALMQREGHILNDSGLSKPLKLHYDFALRLVAYTISSGVISPTLAEVMVLPSRKTVKQSQISSISSSLWDTNSVEMPSRFRFRIILYN